MTDTSFKLEGVSKHQRTAVAPYVFSFLFSFLFLISFVSSSSIYSDCSIYGNCVKKSSSSNSGGNTTIIINQINQTINVTNNITNNFYNNITNNISTTVTNNNYYNTSEVDPIFMQWLNEANATFSFLNLTNHNGLSTITSDKDLMIWSNTGNNSILQLQESQIRLGYRYGLNGQITITDTVSLQSASGDGTGIYLDGKRACLDDLTNCNPLLSSTSNSTYDSTTSSWNGNYSTLLKSIGFDAGNITSGILGLDHVQNVTCASGTVMQNYTSNGAECIAVSSSGDGTGGWINTSNYTNTSLVVNINNKLTVKNITITSGYESGGYKGGLQLNGDKPIASWYDTSQSSASRNYMIVNHYNSEGRLELLGSVSNNTDPLNTFMYWYMNGNTPITAISSNVSLATASITTALYMFANPLYSSGTARFDGTASTQQVYVRANTTNIATSGLTSIADFSGTQQIGANYIGTITSAVSESSGNITLAMKGAESFVNHAGSGIVTNAIGLHTYVQGGNMTNVYGIFDNGSIVNLNRTWQNYYGFYIKEPSGNGVVNNNYGIYIDSTTKGKLLNYSIYSVNGDNYLGGSLTVNNSIRILNTNYQACGTAQEGQIVYNSTTKKHYGCNSTTWNALY